MTTGDKIYELRKQLGLTLEDVGDAVGVGKSTVRKWEKGMIQNMRRDKIHALAVVLKTTPAYLMGWEQVEQTNDIITDAVVRMRSDAEFFSAVEMLLALDSDKLSLVTQMISAFKK